MSFSDLGLCAAPMDLMVRFRIQACFHFLRLLLAVSKYCFAFYHRKMIASQDTEHADYVPTTQPWTFLLHFLECLSDYWFKKEKLN